MNTLISLGRSSFSEYGIFSLENVSHFPALSSSSILSSYSFKPERRIETQTRPPTEWEKHTEQNKELLKVCHEKLPAQHPGSAVGQT